MEYVMGLWIGFALGLLAAIIYAGLSAASDAEDAEDAVLAERMAAFRIRTEAIVPDLAACGKPVFHIGVGE